MSVVIRLARAETLRAALAAMTTPEGGDAVTELLRRRYTVMLERVEAQLASSDSRNARPQGTGRVSAGLR